MQIYIKNLEISIIICTFAKIMMKICFLTDSIFSIGGVQRVMAVIAKELSKEYDVTIISFDKVEDKDLRMYELQEANINYRFFHYPQVNQIKQLVCRIVSGIYLNLHLKSKWSSNIYAHSSFPKERRNALIYELKQGKYDIIIGVHAPLSARIATIKKQLPNIKLIGWIHNSFEALFGKSSTYIGKERMSYYIYQFKKLDNVIVLSNHDAETYNHYDFDFYPLVIYNPLTLKPGQLSKGSSHHFLAIGRFSYKHKGFDLLIEAFHLFAQNNKDWKLDIVGEGNMEFELKKLINAFHLEKRIFIHPFTNRIQDYYSKAQIYVLSSRWEGMPLVLVEAMSHGLPIITSDLPICKEILGDFSMYFENENVYELAERLEESTHINWQEKSKKALKIAEQFNINSIICQWKKIIE